MAARLFFLSLSGKEHVEGRPETELLKDLNQDGTSGITRVWGWPTRLISSTPPC